MADPLLEPALKTPPGFVSQFPTTHSDEQAWVYVATILSTIVPGTLLLLRLYTKLRVFRKVDLTDCSGSLFRFAALPNKDVDISTLSFLFFLSLIIFGRLCLAEGAGVHQWNLPMHNYIKLNYWFYVDQTIYAPTIFLVKTAILLQYLRLFAPQKSMDPFMWYTARIIIVVTGAFYTISTFLTIFACSPREALWNPLITDYRCLNNDISAIISCSFNVVSDITILMLPVRAVWRSRMPTKNKIKIVLLFGIGLLACIATLMIIVYFSRMVGKNADVSYNTAWAGIWVFAEVSLGITVTGTLFLPKFIEAEGTKLKSLVSSLGRPFTSFTSEGSFGILSQSNKHSDAAQEVPLDTVRIIGRSEGDLSFTNPEQDLERNLSYEDVNNPAKYPCVHSTDTPHHVQRR